MRIFRARVSLLNLFVSLLSLPDSREPSVVDLGTPDALKRCKFNYRMIFLVSWISE